MKKTHEQSYGIQAVEDAFQRYTLKISSEKYEYKQFLTKFSSSRI